MPDPKPARLADLDPAALGADAVERILRRLGRLALPLAPGVMVRWDGGLQPDPAARPQHLPTDVRASGLAVTVADLVRYAQAGDVSDWGDPSSAEDALLTVGEALWSRPIDDTAADGWGVDDLRAELADDERDDADRVDPLRLAIGCAVARWCIWRGDAVTTGELAALASVSRKAVQMDALRTTAEGAPKLSGDKVLRGRTRATEIPAAEARRWLAARGAPGWR